MRLRSWIWSFSMLALGVLGLGAAPAKADVVTFVTPTGATEPVHNNPVNASATFTTSTDTITVVLNNLLVNPTAVNQNISDLLFTVSTGQNSGTIDQANSSGTSRTVNSDGTYTDNGTVSPTHWALQTSGGQLYLNDLTGGQPKQTIIGSPAGDNTYAAANGSIAGNSTHNPFLFGPVTFTLNVPGVTADSTITAATFSFDTAAGDNVIGVKVPEPGSIVLAGIGFASLGALGAVRRRARAKVA